jgi:hypothetical protein
MTCIAYYVYLNFNIFIIYIYMILQYYTKYVVC